MYCKLNLTNLVIMYMRVLIVAKCIVNGDKIQVKIGSECYVLIVAKCIVNNVNFDELVHALGINSSKVYCKWLIK